MTEFTPIPYRPLGIIKTLLERLGHQVTHCYEDLVFIEHNAFLLRMEEKGAEVSLFFNTDSDSDQRAIIFKILLNAGSVYGLHIKRMGTYSLLPDIAANTLNLTFREKEM